MPGSSTASIDDAWVGARSRLAASMPGVIEPKTVPSNSLPPERVTTLTTAPVARPYSAL